MKQSLGSLSEGTIVKIYEDGTLAEFIVAKHNYASSNNGTGHTLLVRKTLLSDKCPWGLNGTGTSTSIEWTDSKLKSWLESTYLARLDADVREKLKTLTITLNYRTFTSTVSVPYQADLTKTNPLFGTTTKNILLSSLGSDYFWLADTGEDSWTYTPSGSSESVTEEYGVAYYAYVHTPTRGDAYFNTSYTEQEHDYGVLPCFALYDDLYLGDDGILRQDRAPEISSYYFGTESVHGKRSPFRVPYSVHDEDGDPITVTESMNGTVVRTYTAKDGETNYFTVTQELLNDASSESDQTLKVSATDGAMTAEKTYWFHKVVSTGYKVYIGKITGSSDNTGYYWTERKLLHDAGDESAPIILDPELTLEANEFGSFTFTVPAANPCYDTIALKNVVVSVEEDGTEIFMGQITEWNRKFDLDMEVTCEGELSYLEDRNCIIEEQIYTSSQLLRLAVTADRRFAQEGKAFNFGTVTKQKTGADKDEKETRAISDCWSVAKSYLADKYGGYLRLRKTVKMEKGVRVYRRYLDYLDMPPDQSDQVIEFGTNLLDISYSLQANRVVNSIVVIGYETTGWFVFKNTKEIRAEVRNDASIREFGLCQRYMTVDGTKSTRESLIKKGRNELQKTTEQFNGSITVNAADLVDIGVDTDRLVFMKQARIISESHGLKNWVLCTKEVIPLDAPEEKEFTFGETSQSLSALQAKNFGTAGKAWNAIQSTIKYVKSGG